MRRTTTKRLLGALAVLGMVLATTGPSSAELALVNFQHIYNKSSPGAQADAQGTDIEFLTATVPLRDYATGQKILDELGNEILVTKDFAIMGSYLGGAFVYDITNPEAVEFVRRIPCSQTQNDVQIKQFGARWVLALARDGSTNPCATPQKGTPGAAGIAVFDVTDPYDFKPMYSFRTTGGAHNFTFHPTKPFGWVSTGDLPGGLNHIPIIDFTNVDSPVLAADPQIQGGPHDISFSPDGLRAYVAAENNNRIYDTSDPKAPVQLSITPNDGTYAHGFDPTPDKKIAVGTNESLALGGFFTGTGICPGEGLTFYNTDGANEQHPIPVGYFEANVQGPTSSGRACTAHVGKMAPNNHVMVTGWYQGGVRVVDFSNPSLPQEVGAAAMDDAEVWAAKFYKGPYVYAADMRRGFDVFKWTGALPAPWEAP